MTRREWGGEVGRGGGGFGFGTGWVGLGSILYSFVIPIRVRGVATLDERWRYCVGCARSMFIVDIYTYIFIT